MSNENMTEVYVYDQHTLENADERLKKIFNLPADATIRKINRIEMFHGQASIEISILAHATPEEAAALITPPKDVA